jgi:hypothetical protein
LCLLIVALAAVSIAVLAGCGGSKDPAVAGVGEQSISKASLNHWIHVEAIIDHELPQAPVPTGEVPDPPRFVACAGYLARKARADPAPHSVPSSVTLKQQCRERYSAVREHILRILITYMWLKAEAAKLGVQVSDGESTQQLARYSKEVFKTSAAFQRYLRYTGESLADELLVGKMDLVSAKLERKLISERGVPGATSFFRNFPKRWAAKTNCQAEYVVPGCKQYKGPKAPEAVV